MHQHLLNSKCDSSFLNRGNKQKSVQRTQPLNKKPRKSAARNWKKGTDLQPIFETIGGKCCTGRMERNNQVTYWCVLCKNAMFSNNLVLHVTNKTNFYAVQHGKGNLNILEDEITTFVGVLLLSEYCKVPYRNLYWEDAPTHTMKQPHVQWAEIDFESYYQTFIWMITYRLQKIDTTKYEYYLKSWISISNSMVHLSITVLIKALSLTIGNTAQNNLLEESPLGLGLNFGASPHLKDISFIKNHTVEQKLIFQILVWVRVQMLCWVWLKSVR